VLLVGSARTAPVRPAVGDTTVRTLPPKPPVLAALALGALAGCAAMSGDGSGPVTLSSRVKAAYARYLALPGPQAFAVSTDGKSYGAAYCRWGTCRGNDVNMALESCRRSGKTCFRNGLSGVKSPECSSRHRCHASVRGRHRGRHTMPSERSRRANL
jgi:hypothetical protein